MPNAPANSPAMRGLYTFLFATLIGPFLVAVQVALATLAAGTLHFGPQSLQGLEPAAVAARAGEAGITTFAFAAIPAALAGAGLAYLVYTTGGFGWLTAVLVAVASYLICVLISPVYGVGGHIAPLAVMGAVAALAVHAVLTRAKIVTAPR